MIVKIMDNTQFAVDTGNNGGAYSYTVTYRQIAADDKLEVWHSMIDGNFEERRNHNDTQ